jgi:hypothetical protein
MFSDLFSAEKHFVQLSLSDLLMTFATAEVVN